MAQIKIAHLITRFMIGGAQENTLFTVEELSKNPNYEVTLILGPQTGPEGDLLKETDLEENYRLTIIPELVREINPLKDLTALYKLYRIFKKKKYDIVHTHSSKAGILGRIAAFLSGTKIIIHTIHGLPFHPYQNKFLNKLYLALEKICAKLSDKIITVCDTMKEKALQAGLAKTDKFITIYSGTSLDNFLQAKKQYDQQKTRQKYNFKTDDIIITKIARLFHLKGHKYLIEIASDIIAKFPKVKFLFIGDGILKKELKTQIEQLKLEKNFIFTGLIPPKQIPEILAITDLLVHCSLREGLARVLPYSLAAGIPAISFDIDGACEVIFNNQTGFLVPPKDSQELKNKILEALSHPSLKETVKTKGPETVDPIFRKEYMVSEIEKLYNNLLTKKQD